MISPLLMANKQLSVFQKGKIEAYNDCILSPYDIAKKLNCYHSSIDVFLQKLQENCKLLSKRKLWLQEKIHWI